MESQQTTTQRLAALKQLATLAKDNLFRRIQLAAEVMSDLDWIAQTHGGSDLKAQDALQDEYFSEIGGLVTLGRLLAIYKSFPDEQVWREYKYDLAALDSLCREQQEETEPRQYTNWKQVAEERAEELDKTQKEASRAEELCERQREEIDGFRERIAELENDNAMLRGRIEELEKLVGRKEAAFA